LRWPLLDFYFNTKVVLVWGNQDQPPYNCVRRCLRGIDDKVAETAVIGDAKSTADDRLSISKETATIRRKGKSNARRSLLALMTFGVPPSEWNKRASIQFHIQTEAIQWHQVLKTV